MGLIVFDFKGLVAVVVGRLDRGFAGFLEYVPSVSGFGNGGCCVGERVVRMLFGCDIFAPRSSYLYRCNL
jgi:hypothetical protein